MRRETAGQNLQDSRSNENTPIKEEEEGEASVRGNNTEYRLEWENICDKLIPSLTCPNGSPLALLTFLRCTMFISGFPLTCISSLRPKADHRPRISGGRCRN
eukprot:sb/3478422/